MGRAICIRLIVCLLALAEPAVALAGPFEDGEAAYNKGDYAQALKWYSLAAEKGNPRAQSNLGNMYYYGRGVPKDYAEAVKWYRLAVEQGDARAQSNLGFMYANGQGVLQDDNQAAKWYSLAAEQGDAGAQNNLGGMYAEGQGVPKNDVLAYMWFNLAIAGVSDPKVREKVIENREYLAKRMIPAQITEAQRLAREWKPKT